MAAKEKQPAFRIPFNRPCFTGKEINRIKDAVERGHLSGDGHYSRACSRYLEDFLNAKRALLTPSCTHALEMAYLLLNLRPGDEVIVPSYTFTSTANAFVLRGARPVFVDVRPDTLNMDETTIAAAVTRRTRAIAPVHYAGVPCEMDEILRVAKKHRLAVVEDAAQALGARYKNKLAGTFGDLNAFSFHETKNYQCGEGGALVLPRGTYARRAGIIRQKGTDRESFFSGRVRMYSWVDVGSSFVPSELQAAYLFEQLEKIEPIRRRRKQLFSAYQRAFAPLDEQGALRLPVIPAECESSYHLFYVILSSKKERDRLQAALKEEGVCAVPHYYPLHLSSMGKRFGYRAGQFPVTEKTSERLLRIPLYFNMTDSAQALVIRAVKRFFGRSK